MKRLLRVLYCLILYAFLASNAYAIGLSPARWTVDMREFGSFDSNISYRLVRPTTRYSSFNVSDPAGLSGSLLSLEDHAGNKIYEGIKYKNDNSVVIDWESSHLASSNEINALVNVKTSDLSVSTVEPGTNYIANLVRHSEIIDPDTGIGAVIAIVSQMSIWRNYAPRISLLDSNILGSAVNLNLELEDMSSIWWADDPLHEFFIYSIDWDGDGIIDQDGRATFDEEAFPHLKYPSLFTWSSGLQTSSLSLEHIFDSPGDYIATINVADIRKNFNETASLQVPINVAPVPEPATIILFGTGLIGVFRFKKKK